MCGLVVCLVIYVFACCFSDCLCTRLSFVSLSMCVLDVFLIVYVCACRFFIVYVFACRLSDYLVVPLFPCLSNLLYIASVESYINYKTNNSIY